MAFALVALTAGCTQADDGLDSARSRFPPLILGANTTPSEGTFPFARACPAGGRVEQRDGVVTEYLGADPDRPNLCRMRIGPQTVDGWLGIWLTTWPGAEQAATAIDRLIHGRTGETVAFDVRVSPDYSFHDVLRNEGVETIHLAGKTFHALKISHYREGAEGNIYRFVTTGWKDLASGMLVYVTYQHIAGRPEVFVPVLPVRIESVP